MTTRNTLDDIADRLDRLEQLLQGAADAPMTIGDVASRLQVSKSFVYKLVSGGDLPHYKPNGKRVFFLRRDIDAWVQRNRISSNEELERAASRQTTRSQS